MIRYGIAAAIGVLVLLMLWILVERQILVTRRMTIRLKSLPPGISSLRIVQLSDLHHRQMGKANRRIVRRVEMCNPDLVVITGDLVSRDMRDYAYVAEFLRGLRRICPVYLCHGNHELDLPLQDRKRLEQVIAHAGCRLLNNACVKLSTKRGKFVENLNSLKTPLYLAGIQLEYGVYRDENRQFRHLASYDPDDLTHAIGEKRGTTILLSHNPKFLDTYAAWGADLVLCGHVHGGIVRLPFVGGVLSPERRFFPKYDKGLYRKGDTQMVVSGGIGKLRLFNPPEIVCLEILQSLST